MYTRAPIDLNASAPAAKSGRRRAALALGCCLILGPLVAGSAQAQSGQLAPTTAPSAAAKKNLRLNVHFVKIDADGFVILDYGSVQLKTQLASIRLRGGAGGVLSMILPAGVLLQAEIVQKGAVQSVVLWKGTQNINEQLLIQGVAEGVH